MCINTYIYIYIYYIYIYILHIYVYISIYNVYVYVYVYVSVYTYVHGIYQDGFMAESSLGLMVLTRGCGYFRAQDFVLP